MRLKKIYRSVLFLVLALILTLNVVAVFQAYKFTHFDNSATVKEHIEGTSLLKKIKAAVLGVDLPRPKDKYYPSQAFDIVKLDSDNKTTGWLVPTDSVHAKGTVVMCHGYGGAKSSMLEKSEVFLKSGYNVFMFDFMGAGESEGNQTTIGYYEAEQVKAAYNYAASLTPNNIILFGTSMGAVAIMKAMADYELNVKGVILECPYSTMLRTVQNRFALVGFPKFPMANLLVFWGGVLNGFNAFGLEPVEYAKNIKCPTLLIYGQKDPKVMQDETDEIFENIPAKTKELIEYPEAEHDNYLERYSNEWHADIRLFLIKL